MLSLPFFAKYLLPGLVAGILFLMIFEMNLRIKNVRITVFQRIMVLIMGLYLTVILSVTVSPDFAFSMKHFGQSINMVPFRTLHTAFSNPLNFWGNIIMFAPFGTLLVLMSNKYQRLFPTLSAGAGLSLFIELLQLFSIRSTDIDDIILNTAGTLCGYIIGKLLRFFIPYLHKTTRTLKNTDGKSYKKHNDAPSIAILTMLIFVSIFATGLFKMYNNGGSLSPANEGDSGASRFPVKADKTEKITLEVNGRNAYLWNVTSNTVLYEKESDQQIAPASTTKMLTALTALKYCNEDERVLVGREVHLIAEDASRAWLSPGNELTIRQLLNALLLPSGNDAAFALAVFVGRKICGDDASSIEEALGVFVAAMNEKAAEVGAYNSNFTSPDGYDAAGQYTTAHDLACIARELWRSSVLRGITGSYRITDIWLSGQNVTYNNTNELINPDSQYYCECVAGLKTGKSVAAGCCLVSAAYIDDQLYICVIMGSTEEGRWADSLALYDVAGGKGTVHPSGM
ncbi:MAG: VanZ family protein [Desulfitobacteriaceae bacterium]|nr:VanZ family protein [Desulfitobacteriaceae bacterium]MDD4753800.1 VanZ family protein [Desulfitobacteriaceae bacterium]